jgi:hypothetical protein
MRYLILLPLLFLVSCGLLGPDHTELALKAISEMQVQGVVTLEQAEALRQALLSNVPGTDWWIDVLRVLLEVGLAFAGVRMWRGPAATSAERVARATAKATK